jgi:hypothetical protein
MKDGADDARGDLCHGDNGRRDRVIAALYAALRGQAYAALPTSGVLLGGLALALTVGVAAGGAPAVLFVTATVIVWAAARRRVG